MKTLKITILITIALIISQVAYSQVYYQGTYTNQLNSSAAGINSSASGTASFAMGENTVASGYASFASGIGTEASGTASFVCGGYSVAQSLYSVSIGYSNLCSDYYTTAIGNYLKATESHSMLIGNGYTDGYELINDNAYSLMIGFLSTKPTLFVGTSPGYLQTGKVGIGNVTSPLQKLHLKADEEEIAAMFIEPYNWEGGSGGSTGGEITDSRGEVSLYENGAYLFLGNCNYGVGAVSDLGLLFNTETNFIFNEGNVGINTENPDYNLHVSGSFFTNSFTLYDEQNVPRSGYILVSDEDGNGHWIDPLTNGLWQVNENNENDIYYNNGNVAIGTTETYDYRLAVAGKILTDEVMVKHYDTWPDFVFEPEYKLMPLDEVEAFVKSNKHLPNVKSQAEVKDGYGLSEMNNILLQKIEELTLYIIEQDKEMKAQRQLIRSQEEEINKIKDQLIGK